MRFASWNLRYCGVEQALRRLELLRNASWDLIALQEVSRHAWQAIVEGRVAEAGFCTLDGFGITPSGRTPRGVALLARNGFQLQTARLIPDLPKAERALAATTIAENVTVHIVGWHAPNAASEGVETKMRGYRGIINWLDTLEGPTVIGFDGNHWNRSIDLNPPYVPASEDPWLLENRFFGSNAPHRLRDVLFDHLRQYPHEYEDIVKQRPQGPLVVSYVRGSKANPVEDRFDYIFVSQEVEVTSCSYDYTGAKAVGSDHGLVAAELRLSPEAW